MRTVQHRGLKGPAQMRRGPETPWRQASEHKSRDLLATLNHHCPQPWVTAPTTAMPRTQASTPGQRLWPSQKRRTPRAGRPVHRPAASRRRRCVPAGEQGTPDTRRLEDEGPHKQMTVPRSWYMENGLRGLPATLVRICPQPRTSVPTPVLPQAQHKKGCTVINHAEPRRQRTIWYPPSTRPR